MPRADRFLILYLSALLLGTAASYLVLPIGRPGGLRPGDTVSHLLGVAGSLLMLFGLAYPLVKRTRLSFLKLHWNTLHMLFGAAGLSLVTIHLAGHFTRPPVLVWLAAIGLVVLGAYGRLLSGRFVHAQFASNPYAFLPARPGEADPIRDVVRAKQAVLAHLQPGASEAIFTLAPHHWLRQPLGAARYARLAWREERLVRAHGDRARGPHHLLQRWWRVLHLTLAALLLAGLLAHVVTVTFFAGYAAEGREIYWWHLR